MSRKIEVDEKRGLLIVDGVRFSGYLVPEEPCSECGSPRAYDDFHDAFFCPECNAWLEAGCRDPACEFCSGRPRRPLDGGPVAADLEVDP